MSEQIDRKIRDWSKPMTTKIGNAVEVRDVYRERNSPLTLDSKLLHEAYVSRKKGEITMSLREIKKKIEAINEAIEKRKRQLSLIEQSSDVEQIVKIPLIRNEIEVLEAERRRLVEQAEELRKKMEAQLPKLEAIYRDSVEKERAALAKVHKACRELQARLEELRATVNEAHQSFIPYKNYCDELQVPVKMLHLLEIPFFSQLSRWVSDFVEWCEKTGWKQ
jgi:chromosome segregation ATPase